MSPTGGSEYASLSPLPLVFFFAIRETCNGTFRLHRGVPLIVLGPSLDMNLNMKAFNGALLVVVVFIQAHSLECQHHPMV